MKGRLPTPLTAPPPQNHAAACDGAFPGALFMVEKEPVTGTASGEI
jgi:hypothetical protein